MLVDVYNAQHLVSVAFTMSTMRLAPAERTQNDGPRRCFVMPKSNGRFFGGCASSAVLAGEVTIVLAVGIAASLVLYEYVSNVQCVQRWLRASLNGL